MNRLTALKTLSIETMDHLNFLASIPELQSLKLEFCEKASTLETLDLTSVVTYEDISSLFTIPHPKKADAKRGRV